MVNKLEKKNYGPKNHSFKTNVDIDQYNETKKNIAILNNNPNLHIRPSDYVRLAIDNLNDQVRNGEFKVGITFKRRGIDINNGGNK